MSVLKIKDANGNWVGVTAIKGDKGDSGVSPLISVDTNNKTTYKLRVSSKDKEFITPNLKGAAGSGGGGVAELGTIENYKDFDGENIPPYNMDMPPLPTFMGGTKYAFETPVQMRIYIGQTDKNGNYDIDKYITIDSVYNKDTRTYDCDVKTLENGFLTDYVIYNPIPKKEWDTWTNPNILDILNANDDKIGYDVDGVKYYLPNNRINRYKSGDATLSYRIHTNYLTGQKYVRTGDYQWAVYHRRDFPFILDDLPQFWAFSSNTKSYSNAITIPYTGTDPDTGEEVEPSAEWEDKKRNVTWFKTGDAHTLEYMALDACPPENGFEYWGNTKLMGYAEDIRDNNLLETREYDWVLASPDEINNEFMAEYEAKPLAPAMYVGLKPLHNYTIETTAGACAIVLPGNITNKFITKEKKVQYPSTIKTMTVKKASAQNNVGMEQGTGVGGGYSTGGSKLDNGSVMYMNVIDTSADPTCMIEVPCALSCPNKYLNRGESFTFQVEDEDQNWGIWVLCENEEDYKGIKIVEGVEPYSQLMYERMNSGATKFNIKAYATKWDANEIMGEYNIKLSDNTKEGDYCRLLNTFTTKRFDIDDFTMVGHTHKMVELEDLEEYVDALRVPTMHLSTSPLIEGESLLPENTFYFVYEE